MTTNYNKPAILVLEDGRCFRGHQIGADVDTGGEVVFNTAMSGYQEILTDPSYAGQIVVMTYPMIGNYGIAPEDFESRRVFAKGLVVKEASRISSNWRHERSLHDYLVAEGILGICDIETRALVRHLRDNGAMRGVITTRDESEDALRQRAMDIPSMQGLDLASLVTTDANYTWEEPTVTLDDADAPPRRWNVVALDLGIKRNILRNLVDHGCRVTVVPAKTTAQEILALNPDGVMLSNGPGDPEPVGYAIDTVRELLGRVPIFGICLGYQLLALAVGGKTFKLKFGHRGANHPVQELESGRVEITSQNHGFCVDPDSLDPNRIRLTHKNLNDQTLAGISLKDVPAFGVQYHPEAAPGPHDARYLFERFAESMRAFREESK